MQREISKDVLGRQKMRRPMLSSSVLFVERRFQTFSTPKLNRKSVPRVPSSHHGPPPQNHTITEPFVAAHTHTHKGGQRDAKCACVCACVRVCEESSTGAVARRNLALRVIAYASKGPNAMRIFSMFRCLKVASMFPDARFRFP